MITTELQNLDKLEIPKTSTRDVINRALLRRYNVAAHDHLLQVVEEIDVVEKLINGCIEQLSLQHESSMQPLINTEEAQSSIRDSVQRIREHMTISALCLMKEIVNELGHRSVERTPQTPSLAEQRRHQLLETINLIDSSNSDLINLHTAVVNLNKWFGKFSQKGYETLSFKTPLSLTVFKTEFLAYFCPTQALHKLFLCVTHNSTVPHFGLAGINEKLDQLRKEQTAEIFQQLSVHFQDLRNDILAVRI